MTNAPPRHTEPNSGCALAYWIRGDGPPVLFIQGTGLHGHGWLPQVESLQADHECLWFDNRGIGLSQPAGNAPISVEQMALDAVSVLDAAGWRSAHVVGHSLGGCVAIELALSSPSRVRSLSLLCTSADGPGLVRFDLAMLWRGIRMSMGSRASRRRAFLEMVLTRAEHANADLDDLARELEPLYGHDLAVTPPIAMKQVRAMRRWNAMACLSSLEYIPTLVVGASEDVIARPDLVRSTAAGIPGAKLVEIPNAAHGVTVTAPSMINNILRDHILKSNRRQSGEKDV